MYVLLVLMYLISPHSNYEHQVNIIKHRHFLPRQFFEEVLLSFSYLFSAITLRRFVRQI